MDNQKSSCKTWRDVLAQNGASKDESENFIGFVAWNKGDVYADIGSDINRLLNEHTGRVFSRDVSGKHYNDRGIVFTSTEISPQRANEFFDIIMEYEQEDVYRF